MGQTQSDLTPRESLDTEPTVLNTPSNAAEVKTQELAYLTKALDFMDKYKST